MSYRCGFLEIYNLRLSIPSLLRNVFDTEFPYAGYVMFLQDVAHVINYDMPNQIEMYTHRIGKFSCP